MPNQERVIDKIETMQDIESIADFFNEKQSSDLDIINEASKHIMLSDIEKCLLLHKLGRDQSIELNNLKEEDYYYDDKKTKEACFGMLCHW